LQCVEAGHSFVDDMVDDAGTTAQRVRIGLTGLAFAFLLVLLGSVISRSGDDRTPAEKAADVNIVDAEPSEPLAELGVAPGGSESQNNSSAETGHSQAPK
jgi:hypothetical protein